MDRRNSQRCPICAGPGVADDKMPGGIKCRSSICIHNHAEVVCPRCKEKDLEGVMFKNGAFEFTCKECLHKWSVAG